MPQQAQQDYLTILAESLEEGGLGNDATRAIVKAVRNGTIYDVILRDESGKESRVIGITPIKDGKFSIVYFDYGAGGIIAEELTDPDAE